MKRTFQTTSGGALTTGYFVHDGDQIVLELESDGDVAHRLLWGPAVDQALADEIGSGDVYWYLTDHLGTVRDVVQYDSGTGMTDVANHLAFDSFGRRTSETFSALADFDLGFTGKWLDRATGLQWNQNRWYNPAIQRWMSEDIVWDGTNKYAYVGNRPTTYIDPSGLEGEHAHTSPEFDRRRDLSHLTGGTRCTGEWPERRNDSEGVTIDGFQNTLEFFGLVPVVGEAFDAINGAIYAGRGEFAEAGLSFVSMVPVVGDAAGKGGKVAKRVAKHRHHADPLFMGGSRAQKTTEMAVDQHRQLHRNLNDFLRTQCDEFGNHMRPQRGNSAAIIQNNFDREKRVETMSQFYKDYRKKYPDAAKDFFNQHPQQR